MESVPISILVVMASPSNQFLTDPLSMSKVPGPEENKLPVNHDGGGLENFISLGIVTSNTFWAQEGIFMEDFSSGILPLQIFRKARKT